MNSSAGSHQQSFKTSPTSLIDTFRRITLPADAAAGVSYVIADDSHTPLDLNTSHSSQAAVSYPVSMPGYFTHSPGYLSPTGSIETAALRELQAFAGGGGMDHVSTQSPDTTDSAGGYSETSSSIGQSTSSVANDDSRHGVKESPFSPSPSICTMCGRGCGCQKQPEDVVYRQTSQDSMSSWNCGSVKGDLRPVMFDAHCQCAPQCSSPASFSSSSSLQHHQQQQQQQSAHCDITSDIDMFSAPRELSRTLQELSIAARESPTGSTADLIEHTIQAVVDAHVTTCLYTSDKVAAGQREYELMLSTKPLVS